MRLVCLDVYLLLSHKYILDGVHNQVTAHWAHGFLASTLGNELVGTPLAHAQVLTRHQQHALLILHAHNAHAA